MKTRQVIGLTALTIALATTPRAFAQSASESMHEAGDSAKSAVTHAFEGTKTAVDDSALTAKVKTALHEDKVTYGSEIHVTTVAGVVTLKGSVASADIASQAGTDAQNTAGVKGVKNKLKHP